MGPEAPEGQMEFKWRLAALVIAGSALKYVIFGAFVEGDGSDVPW